MAKKQADEKIIKALAWEYLKRSDLYRKYCEWQREKTKMPSLKLPEIFHPATEPMQDINPIVTTFLKYGDIHTTSFDEWYYKYYEDDDNGKQIPFKNIHGGSVDDLSGASPGMKYFMRNTFIYIIDRCKTILGREPSLLEMADFLCAQMRMEREFESYLKIKQLEFTIEEVNRLTKEVKDILKKKIPAVRQRIDELNRYLKIYDVWKKNKGKGWVSVVIKTIPFYRDKKNTEEGTERMIKRDLAKAQKLIKQAEKDQFLTE